MLDAWWGEIDIIAEFQGGSVGEQGRRRGSVRVELGVGNRVFECLSDSGGMGNIEFPTQNSQVQ